MIERLMRTFRAVIAGGPSISKALEAPPDQAAARLHVRFVTAHEAVEAIGNRARSYRLRVWL